NLFTGRLGPSSVGLDDDEGDHRLTRRLVAGAHHGGLRNPRVRDERVLDLRRGQAVAGDVHDVIDATQQPDVAVDVLLGAIAGEVHAVELVPVGLRVALAVAPEAAQHAGPRLADHQVAALAVGDGAARVIHHVGDDAGQRCLRGAGLG